MAFDRLPSWLLTLDYILSLSLSLYDMMQWLNKYEKRKTTTHKISHHPLVVMQAEKKNLGKSKYDLRCYAATPPLFTA